MDKELDRHTRIRARAYRLWLQAGPPQARDEEFWRIAVEIENAQPQMKEPALREPSPSFP
jgi:hypothetical protein